MLRIGIEAQRIFRKKKHGMDMVALELIRNLQLLDQKNSYYIFTKEDEDMDVINESENFRIIKVKSSPYPLWEQYYLPRAVKEYKIDLLHCTSNTAPEHRLPGTRTDPDLSLKFFFYVCTRRFGSPGIFFINDPVTVNSDHHGLHQVIQQTVSRKFLVKRGAVTHQFTRSANNRIKIRIQFF